MNKESELLKRSIVIFKSILLDSIEENEQDKAIYEILKDADELPHDYVPYWMADEPEDTEIDPAHSHIVVDFENFEKSKEEDFTNIYQSISNYLAK